MIKAKELIVRVGVEAYETFMDREGEVENEAWMKDIKSAVSIIHTPTKIDAYCNGSKSQVENKKKALKEISGLVENQRIEERETNKIEK